MNEQKITSPVAYDIKAGMKSSKIVPADEAIRIIGHGDSMDLDGVMGGRSPDELT